MNQNECPVKNSINDNKESSCPIKHDNSSYIDGYSKYFKSLFFKHEEVKDVKSSEYNPAANDMHFNQIPMDGQKVVLSTQRTLSSIPKGEFTPEHQPVNAEKWVYPSEQQYFNAMKVIFFNMKTFYYYYYYYYYCYYYYYYLLIILMTIFA